MSRMIAIPAKAPRTIPAIAPVERPESLLMLINESSVTAVWDTSAPEMEVELAIWIGPVLVAPVVNAEDVVEVNVASAVDEVDVDDEEQKLSSSGTTQNQSVRSA